MISNAKKYFEQGVNYQIQGDYSSALNCFTHAINLDPQWAIFYKTRAELYHSIGENLKAIDDLKKAIYIDQSVEETIEFRASIYKELEELDLAIEDFTQAILLSKNTRKEYSNLYLCEYYLKRGQCFW